MIVIDANPASFRTGTYGWNSYGAVSLALQRKAGPKEYTPSFSSFPGENCSFTYFCAGTWSFWYYSLPCWEEMIFQHRVWGHLHSESVTSWREGKSVWVLVSCGKKGDLPAYLWEEVGAVESPGWLEEDVEETTVRVPVCSPRQQQWMGDMAVRWRCRVGRAGDGRDQNFAGVGVEGMLTTCLLCL